MNLRNRLPFYISLIQQGLEWFGYPLICTKAKAKPLKNYKVYGNTVQGNLPEGYTQLEYIESTTSQYINTGIKGELESELTFIGQRTGDNPNQTYGHLWGDLAVSAMSISFNTPKTASASGSSRFGDKVTSSSTSPIKVIPLNTPVTIIQNKDGATTSTGFEIVFDATTEFETENPLFLFTAALSGGGPTASSHKWKCEYFSHKKNGVLVQEFIPCKNAQGEIGMYDTVSGNFFKSETSTSFVAGPEVQPTPTEPLMIESVGDKTVNLFNKETIVRGKYISQGGAVTANASFCYGDYISVLPNKEYTISGNNKGGTAYRRIHAYGADQKWLQQIQALQVTSGADYTMVFTTPEDCTYIRFSGMSSVDDYEETNLVQIQEGSVATEYEPYNMYKIPVNVANKNMLNPNAEIFNGYIGLMNVGEAIKFGSSTASKTYKKFAYFKPGTYTYSYNGSASTGSLRFVLCDENEIVREIVSTPVVQGRNEVTVTFTKEGWGYVSVLVVATDIQIEKGDTATKYEPYFNQTTNIYLSEPLRKLGDLTDYIDYAEQKVVRQVGVVDGSTFTWARGSYGGTGYYTKFDNYTPIPANLDTAVQVMTEITTTRSRNEAYNSGSWIEYSTFMSATGNLILITLENTTPKCDIYYGKITPTEESITLPEITLPGEVTITTETTVKPSDMYGKQ